MNAQREKIKAKKPMKLDLKNNLKVIFKVVMLFVAALMADALCGIGDASAQAIRGNAALRQRQTTRVGENKPKTVSVYLVKHEIDPSGANSYELVAVKRKVDGALTFRSALETLFAVRMTRQEKAAGLSSAAANLKLEAVKLKNGTALVKFSQARHASNFGVVGPMILVEAVEKTAKQFPAVKRVRFCAVGETTIDETVKTPFPRCS